VLARDQGAIFGTL